MIYLVRHGERADNCPIERSKVTNPYDPHLTKKGCEQAKKAGKIIEKELGEYSKIEVQSSPFQRCITTAQNISRQIDAKSIAIKTEICETLYTHLFKINPLPSLLYNVSSNHKTFHKDIDLVDEQTHGSEFYPETLEDVNSRIINYVESLLKTLKEDQCVILVTHQRPLKAILEYLEKDASDVGYCKVISLKKQTDSVSLNECLLTVY